MTLLEWMGVTLTVVVITALPLIWKALSMLPLSDAECERQLRDLHIVWWILQWVCELAAIVLALMVLLFTYTNLREAL